MIEIYTDAGLTHQNINLSYDVLISVMNSERVKDDAIIQFRFSDGERGAIIKKHITGFSEISE